MPVYNRPTPKTAQVPLRRPFACLVNDESHSQEHCSKRADCGTGTRLMGVFPSLAGNDGRSEDERRGHYTITPDLSRISTE